MKKTLIIVVSCVSMLAIQAQENLKNEVIDVVKDFKPKVMQATKIKSQPVFIDTSKVSENLSYKIRFEEFRVQQQTDSLTALLLLRPDLNKLYTKHVEFGLGSLLNPHLSMDMSNGRHTKQFYRLYFNYDGAYASALPTEDQFSHLKLGAAYKHVFDDFILQSDAHLNDLYRFDTADQRFHNSVLNFNSKLQFTDSSKVWIPATLQMSAMGFYKESQSEERLFSVESQHEGMHEKLNQWTFKNNFSLQHSASQNYVHWQSQLKSKKKFNLADAQMALAVDVLQSNIKLIPELSVQYQLIEKGLYSSFELGGDRALYTLRDLYTSNPYLQYFVPEDNSSEVLPSNTKYYTRLGLNGNLFGGVSYQVSVAAASQDNFMHYVHHSNAFDEWMAPAYTALKSLELHAGLDAQWTENLHFWLKADYKSFDQDLSYVPNTEFGLYGSYHYNEQWYLSGSLRYIGERDAIRHDELVYPDYIQKLDPVFDLNTKLHFAYNEHIGFYLEGLNLLNQDFVLWRETPVLGRQVNFGARYRF